MAARARIRVVAVAAVLVVAVPSHGAAEEPEPRVMLLVKDAVDWEKVRRGLPVHDSDTVLGWRELSVPESQAEAMADQLRASGAEVSKSVDYELLGPETEPFFDDQWYLDNTGQTDGTPGADIGVEEAWETGFGNAVVVAVVDTGIDLNHPELSARLVPGWDFIEDDASPHSTTESHGTAVAALIVSDDNGIGIAGVAPSARVMPLRACTQPGGCDTLQVAEAVKFAVDGGADIINLSLGGKTSGDEALRDAVDYAQLHGVLIVAASGNDGEAIDDLPGGDLFLPAGFPNPNILSVAWSTHTDTLDPESNYGAVSVDVVAPGGTSFGFVDQAMVTALAGGGYTYGSGTSFAAPMAAGVAALLLGQDPTLQPAEIVGVLIDTVDVIGSMNGKVVSGGRIDAGRAMAQLLTASEPLIEDSGWFIDDDDSVFEADIEWLAAAGITRGCNPPTNDRFCPYDPISREVMAVYLSRALDLPAATQDFFDDDNTSQFEDDINRVAEAGIAKGCGERKFCPGNVVDRGQLAAFFSRAYGLSDNGGGDLFIDDDNSIFENDIDRLATAGITIGCNPPDNTMYCPHLPLDRGAIAAFFHRASEA